MYFFAPPSLPFIIATLLLDDQLQYVVVMAAIIVEQKHKNNNWGEPERAPHDQLNGDRVCLSICPSVHRTFTFRIYACSNLTQMCNISLVQSACYSASAIVRVQFTERSQATVKT